jgi:hypothetical protein
MHISDIHLRVGMTEIGIGAIGAGLLYSKFITILKDMICCGLLLVTRSNR